MKKYVFTLALVATTLFAFTACGGNGNSETVDIQETIPAADNSQAYEPNDNDNDDNSSWSIVNKVYTIQEKNYDSLRKRFSFSTGERKSLAE